MNHPSLLRRKSPLNSSAARRGRGLINRWTALVVLALLPVAGGCKKKSGEAEADQFTRLTNLGKSQLEGGEATKAIEFFRQAAAIQPTMPEAQLNLANAYLLANQSEQAIQQAQRVLQVDPNSAAAHYLIGCANLRLGRAEEALKALQQSYTLDPAVTALNFQLGLAHERMGHTEDALRQYQTVVEFEPEHPAAHYRLSQLLLRLGRQEEAAEELKKHQESLAKKPNLSNDVSLFERSKHTQAKLPFKLEQPARDGIKVVFSDVTASKLTKAEAYRGPMGVVDLAHDGRSSLLVREGDGFRLLLNSNGQLIAQDKLLPGLSGGRYRQMLVGDLQNDQTEDVVVLGETGSHIFKVTTNGVVTEVTKAAGLNDVKAVDGVLLDFDYTGKLGLLVLRPEDKGVRALRNLSSTFAMYFSENNVTSGLPATVVGARQLLLEDWNNDELMDVTLTRDAQPPLINVRERGGPFVETNLGAAFPPGGMAASGDLNNDSLPDFVAARAEGLQITFSGGKAGATLPALGWSAKGLALLDYDNDGWLDLFVFGQGVRVWRNRGDAGFLESTAAVGLAGLSGSGIDFWAAADLDNDCDTDLVVASETGLKIFRNENGNKNHQLKLRLVGHRSNASGLGVRYEVSAGGLRAWRTVKQLPIEVGVGQHAQVDSVAIRWFDGFINHDEIKVTPCALVALDEIEKPTGSCPYLYAWDGQKFRFVTDLLGAAPLGLPISDTRFVDADPVEYVWIGDEKSFLPRNGNYILQITEELREVLYLDEAKLVVVDHPANTEVHTTGKLLPSGPFPSPELVTLHQRRPLLRAVNHEGREVTEFLQETDSKMVSPTKLRARQLRGLAEPHSVILDFGSLEPDRPWVLALTGWLRFGGGMANIGASHTPDLPFPFPTLEVEVAEDQWQSVDVVFGAPAGKTKTIIVDLTGKLPPSSRRLKVRTAFEIHWDRIGLFVKRDDMETRIVSLKPGGSDLHWRGYSEFEPWPWFLPLTPRYDQAKATADWTIAPSGWCTRYGSVDELVGTADDALALVNGGDELTLTFPSKALPAKAEGASRDFFIYTVGWDKDSDFHCELGWAVEPLPWRGMNSQAYGRDRKNVGEWTKRFNTRWVGPRTLTDIKPRGEAAF